MGDVLIHKECFQCKWKKPLSDFYTSGPDRVCSYCKMCARKRAVIRDRQQSGWSERLTCKECGGAFPRSPSGRGPAMCEDCRSNPNRITKCNKCEQRKPRSEFKRKNNVCRECLNRHCRMAARESRIFQKFGISYEEKRRIFNEQEGRCASCLHELRPMGVDGNYDPSLDHSHATGKIRGILCDGCNPSDGLLGGDHRRTFALAMYQSNDGPYYGPITVTSDLGTWTSTVERVDGELGRVWVRAT